MKPKALLSLIFALVMVLSLTLTAYAQGTTGTGDSDTDMSGDGGQLNTGTGSANVPPGTAKRGTADPVSTDGLDDLGGNGNSPPPTGQNFLSEGLTLNLFDDAGPLTSFPHPVQVCFPAPVGGGAIRFWDAFNGIWQIFPTTAVGSEICTWTSVPGTFAVIG